MGAGPYLPKAVVDAARRYDRMLSILWCPRRDRFTLVRFRPDAVGQYVEVHTFEGECGEFVMPTEASVTEFMVSGDITRVPGATFQDKIRNYIRKQNEHNRRLREKAREAAREQNLATFGEYHKAAKRFGGNFEDLSKYMGERKELKEAQ